MTVPGIRCFVVGITGNFWKNNSLHKDSSFIIPEFVRYFGCTFVWTGAGIARASNLSTVALLFTLLRCSWPPGDESDRAIRLCSAVGFGRACRHRLVRFGKAVRKMWG